MPNDGAWEEIWAAAYAAQLEATLAFWGYVASTVDASKASTNLNPTILRAEPAGRRLRAFAFACYDKLLTRPEGFPFRDMPWAEAIKAAEQAEEFHVVLANLPLTSIPRRRTFDRIPTSEEYAIPTGQNREDEVTAILQDLAWEITDDITEACDAFDNPDAWYPGVDDGIEPVTDEHVELVIWGLQRELNREPRIRPGGGPMRPAPPLNELPWRVQRALAERRRLRYLQFGIGREQWERNSFSLWDIWEDPDWLPRRVLRQEALKNGA